MYLEKKLEEVKDRKSFLEFVDALVEDRKMASHFEKRRPADYQLSGDDWQSTTIESYLETAATCLEDHNLWETNSDEITWKKMAEFLYGGKIYE